MLAHRPVQPAGARPKSPSRYTQPVCGLLFLLGSLALCGRVRAAEETPRPESAELRKAAEALRQGNLGPAQELLQTAFQKNYEPRVLCLMGQLAKALGRATPSYDFYRRCLEEGGATLDAALKQEAAAMTASIPGRTGEILGISKKGGFLWVEGLLTARVRPGEPAHVTLPVGKQSVHLGSGAAFDVLVQPQNICDVELDQKQVSCASSILLLPFGQAGPLPMNQPQLATWWSQFATQLRKENGRLVTLPRQQALFRQSPQTIECLTAPACQVKLGKLADASYVLGLQLDPAPVGSLDAPKQDYKLRAWLIETRVEQSTVQEEQVCERCSLAELEQAMGELVGRVFAGGQRPVRMVSISSTPLASAVVDGAERGRTPLQLWLFPGAHEVKIQSPYFYPLTQRIDVLEDTMEEVQKFQMNLRALPVSHGERAIRYGAWLTGGLGLAAVATGLGLYLRPDDPVAPAGTQAGYLLSTRNPGIGVLAAGGAMLVTSVILIVVDRYSHSKRRSQ